MTPREYEFFAARYFEDLGYRVDVTAQSQDYGIDIFAHRDTERLGIQAKMYGNHRPINREMIMQLAGAARFFDCTGAFIVTDARVRDDAQKVATKLEIEIVTLLPHDMQGEKYTDSTHSQNPRDDFDSIWEKYVIPLEGQVIAAPDGGLENIIISVNSAGLTRVSKNGKQSDVPIEIFRLAINHVLRHGSISRSEINEQYQQRASSLVMLVLQQIPLFEPVLRPKGVRLLKS